MASSCKRRRVLALAGNRNLSDADVAHVYGTADDEADPVSRSFVRRVLADFTDDALTTLTLPRSSGSIPFEWTIAKFQQLLPLFVGHCEGFRDAFIDAASRHSCTKSRPWRLVLYVDDVVPGNQLRLDNKRKATAWYIGIVEMGLALRSESAWLPLAVLRASESKCLRGGFAAAARAMLRSLLLGCESVATCGVPIATDGQPRVFYFRLCRIIGDEVATKAVFDSKGFSGIKCCSMGCKNVVRLRRVDGVATSLEQYQEDDYLVTVACADPTKFDLMTDDDVWRSHDLLAAAANRGATRAELDELQTALGFSLNPHGVLADVELRAHVLPRTCLLRDSMHVTLANGLMGLEIGLLLRALADSVPNFSFAVLRTLAGAPWRWSPNCLAPPAFAQQFSPAREAAWKESGVFKSGASDLIQTYVFLRYFVGEHVPPHIAPLQRASFLALCRVLDLIAEAKRHSCPAVLRGQLIGAVGGFMRSHQAAYGLSHTLPKHHYLWHVVSDQEDDLFLDCFVHERKNKIVKASMTHILNTRAFEGSAIRRLITKVAPLMCEEIGATKLLGVQTWRAEMSLSFGAPSWTARSMLISGSKVHVGLVVMGAGRAMEVKGCAKIGDVLAVIVDKLALLSNDGAHSRWRRTGVDVVEDATVVRYVTGWFESDDGSLVVLH